MCFFIFFLRCGEVVVPSDSTFDEASHLAAGDVRVDNTYICVSRSGCVGVHDDSRSSTRPFLSV